MQLRAEIAAPDGSVAAEVRTGVTDGALSAIFRIDRPLRWDVDAPNLYTARVQLTDGDGNALDDTQIRFGVRTFAFTPDGGFFLNGRPLKLQGVCGHHDLGSLGAAVSVPAWYSCRYSLSRELPKISRSSVLTVTCTPYSASVRIGWEA